MTKLDKIQVFFKKSGQSMASLVKVPLMSGRPSAKSGDVKDTIIVMGNGPSLRTAMEEDMDVLMKYPRLAVNLSALTPDFACLKPQYYILADIAFFLKNKTGKVPAL